MTTEPIDWRCSCNLLLGEEAGHADTCLAFYDPVSAKRTQWYTHDDTIPMPGDCFRACVASLLRLEMDEVPHFVALEDHWLWCFKTWLAEKGYQTATFPAGAVKPLWPHIIGGRSPRGIKHACVGIADDVRWDPHPSREGLLPPVLGPWTATEWTFIWPRWGRVPFAEMPY